MEIVQPQDESVTSINSLTGDVILAAGANISLSTVGQTITINSTALSSVAWGSITGTLSNQTDLQTALNTKQATGNYITALTGDGTASGPGSVALTLATVNANVGTFGSATQSTQITVNSKGLITAIANVTVTPAVGSITGLGTGVATALGVNIGSAGAFITFNGNAGTPSALVGTNISGTAASLTAGNVTTNANMTGPITSVGNSTAIASQTGTGTKFVVDTSPTIITPTFTTNFTSPIWKPASDSITAIQITKTDGSTVVVNVDTTNARFGINTTAPSATFHVSTNDSVSAFFDVYNAALGQIPTIMRAARGTQALPTALKTDDIFGGIAGRGYGATGFSAGGRANIFYASAEDWSDTVQGSYMVFKTTPIGTASITERMRITDVGNLKIAGTVKRGTTEGTNHLDIFDGTAPVGTLTNGVSFYSASGVGKIINAAGTVTTIGPHDMKTGEWIFESTHTGDKYGTPGRTLYVNMEKMLRAINDKFGWDFVKEYYMDSEGNKVSEAEAKVHYENLKKINN